MKVFTAGQMRELDRLTVELAGVPYATLMETAGARVVEAIVEHYGPVGDRACAVFCGKGNNGGDGAVVARLLWLRGARVAVHLCGAIGEAKGETRANFEAVWGLAASDPRLSLVEGAGDAEAELVVDALLGTGLARPAEGLYAEAIAAIDRARARGAKVISVDIPSGLSSDSDRPIGPHVTADLTVAFTGPKIGNVLPPACYANGRLIVAPIGTPERLLDEAGSRLHLVEEAQVAAWLRLSRRAPDAHKGAVGDVLVIAGSRGKTGAAALASEAALRSGAGLVTVATARSAQPLLVTQAPPEVMTEPLEETDEGAVAEGAAARALELAARRTVLALGPGLSSSDAGTRRFVAQTVGGRTAPLLIDADGLNALSPWGEDLQGSDELPLVITPHPGEMARLTGRRTDEVLADRVGVAREFATTRRVITVLKGSRTLVAAPDGAVYVNPTGNAGMATAGAGDVLTGLTAGLLAQRPGEPLRAVVAAVYLHGLAGEMAAATLGQRALIASDITGHLGAAFVRVGGDEER